MVTDELLKFCNKILSLYPDDKELLIIKRKYIKPITLDMGDQAAERDNHVDSISKLSSTSPVHDINGAIINSKPFDNDQFDTK